MFHNKIIENVINATSLETLCCALNQCQEVLRNRFTNKAVFIDRLQNKISRQVLLYEQDMPEVHVLNQTFQNILIYEDRKSYLKYASFKLNSCVEVDELNIQIEDIIDFFWNKFTKTKTDVLSLKEITDIFSIVQRKYNLLNIIMKDKVFEIYLLNRSHICYDSFLLSFKNKNTGLIYKKWILFSLSPCYDNLACNKYFVFLHELGHCFYSALIQENGKELEGFKEIIMISGIQGFNDENSLSELFSDLFAAVSLNDSCYSAYNPFRNIISERFLELYELYFKMVLYRKNTELYYLEKEFYLLNNPVI